MSREGANNRIDSLKNTLNTDHYQRSALGNAVRFNTMLNLFDDFLSAEIEGRSINTNTGRFEGSQKSFTKDEFTNALEQSVVELRVDFEEQIADELGTVDRRFDNDSTVQQKLQNRAYKTELGQTVAHATVQRKGMYQDFNTSYSTGATGAFRSFTNGFVQDDEDFFGSRVLYDNVFGQYEDGGESLSSKARIAASDPTNDTRTVSEKVLDNVVNKSIYDQTEIVDRVDIEFGRFHGNSMIDQMSMTGSGLKAARQTIRTVMQEGSAYGRQVAARGEDGHPIVLAQALSDRTGNDLENVNTALNLLNNNLSNRSSTTNNPDGGYVNKAGVAEFIDLINSAGTRDSNGALTGGKISISTFQFQNETISAALSDKIQRHVLESVLQGGGAPLEIDVALAYPRQRNTDKRQDNDGRYAVGMTNYSILGPNLIEALKMEEVKADIQDMLVGLGIPKEDVSKYVNLNIGFRDKKFHPKVYLTDNMASIGTQNLTAPVGSSVNQAGSNFETMRFVSNTFKNDEELEEARKNFIPLGQDGLNQVYNNQITQSLLYRQISDSVQQERLYSEGNLNRSLGGTTTPILNNKTNSQVGFAGDIYQHLSNTLNFAHKNAFIDSQSPQTIEIKNSNSLHMFMVLDQSFMLQLGSNSAKALLSGEMGEEIGTTPYNKDNIQAQRYKAQQNKLFDLLITDKANVVVDTKNFERQVLKPLLDKINEKDPQTGTLKNQKLKSNFEKYGQSLSMMAGFELLKPTGSIDSNEYNRSLNVMFKELKRLGFTKEAGFEEDDLKQIIGLASNNIERANVPKQHAKEFGLFDYSDGAPQLISYYQGSSNMGLYSLGIESGEDGRYMPGDGSLTNTEMGIMLGRRDIDNNLSRATQTNLRLSPEYAFEQNIFSNSKNQWVLNEEEEQYELMLAQRHFSTTWNQLARTNLETIKTKQFSGAPSWQENVNTKDLVVLKTRLETMSKDLGLSSDIFTITEKYGDKSGSGLTSISVSIDMNRIMTSTEFMRGTNSNLPRLNFELSVLQGPSKGEGMFHDSAVDGDVSGYVYFVDKNRVIGNGLFTNDSGKDVSVLGRNNYEDNFESDIYKGRINLKSGQSAHMSSLDIVPQLFATLMGEAVNRFGTKESMKVFDTGPDNAANFNMASVKELLLDYVAISLTGYSTQMDETIKQGSNIVSSMKLIQDNLNVMSLQDLNETVNRHARSIDNEMDSSLYQSKDPLQRNKDKDEVARSLEELNNKWFHKLKGGKSVSEGDVEFYINDLFELAQKSPQLANMIVKTAYKDPNKTSKLLAFKEFQTLLFGSFLQTKDERTYGGQQGFYKTLLMGVGNSTIDKNTADLMFDLDTEKGGLHNLNAYARFKPLEYTPLTDIHDVLYRSIASKSTSLTKNDDRLDSVMFESEARDLGDAANLRLMSSLGIGSVLNRDDFIQRNNVGEREIGNNQKEIFEAMEKAMIASGSDPTAINNARQMYLDSVEKEFGDLDSEDRKDTIRLRFYTGSSKKLSQLPQRIKNAMGARPMYQFSIDAQMALERGESLNELSDNYLQQYRQPIVLATKNKVEKLLEERERLVTQYGEEHERVINIDNQIDDLKIIGSKAFNSKVSGLGAVFSGRIKSVLNQEQINFITKTKERLQASMGDLIQQGELSQSVLDELIRVEVLKAGLTNKGLGKMIVGNNHMNYGMAFIQLSGTYNDTSLNNPLYGTVYHSKDKYDSIRKHSVDIYDNTLSPMDRDYLGVYTLGQKEGHYDTKQESIKGSMIGAGGMEVLLQADDIIVEDKSTGNFVHKRKVNGEWTIIGQVDDSRNVQSVRNVVDRTGFSEVGSPTVGSSTMSAYGRKGENSVDYIYTVENRAGVFANNEYLLTFDRIRAMDPGSARRVEGTDSGALIKAVATFAGRVKYSSIQDNSLVNKEMNVFENIEEQIMRSYEAGEVKGSLKAYLDARDETQRVTLQDGRTGYAPLSSSIHGLYNANNFKSFFWSHGATILRAQTEDNRSFMLDSLFDTSDDKTSIDNAKKLAGALLVNFGTDFLQTKEGTNSQENITQLKRSLISEMIKGEFGSHYQGVALEQTRVLGGRVEEIFTNETLRKGRNKEQIVSDLLYEKIGNQVGFNASKVGALSAVSSEQLTAVLKGDSKASSDLLNLVRQGIMDPVAKQAQAVGGINFNNSSHTQAALIVTAVDLMHQISSQGSKLKIPSDIDFDSDKVKDILLTVLGSSKSISDEETDDIMQFLSGVNSNVSTISVFTDIVFSYSKDATSTQSVARHEGQHLITPFMGDIKKYQEGGKLSHIQHTVASITAMVTGQESGMIFYDQMAKAGFKDKQAVDLTSEESDYLFSSFNKSTYLGFYQSNVSGATTNNYVKEYKSINKLLLKGDYDWEAIQTVRDANDKTKFADEDLGRLDFDEEGKPGLTAKAYSQVQRFVNKFHANESDLEKARRVDAYLMMGGDKFALHQLNELTTMMSIENSRYQADSTKSTGRDTVDNLLKSMTNKRQYFSLPELSFEMQNGEIIARASNTKSLSTMLPSAEEMRVLGAEYSDFVDPVLNHYKNLSSIFVPGTIANTAFEKVRLASRDNRAIVLSTEEYKAMASVMDSARMMVPELAKASASSRTQEAFAGKNKYQGFTSTGIGNLLMPFDSVALAQSKLDEVGMTENLERFELMRQSDIAIKAIEEDRSYYIADDYKSPSLSRDPWLDSVSGKTIPHSNSIDYKNKPELRSNRLLPSGKYFTQKERFGPPLPITLKDNREVLGPSLPAPLLIKNLRQNIKNTSSVQELNNLAEMLTSDTDFLSSKFNQKGIQVNYKSDLQPGVAGEYNPKLGIINIDNNMSASEKASTLLHELVHVYQEKNEIPLWGLQKHSSRANPEIHGSRALDSEVNLKEWQAFSIEAHYKELFQKDPKEATEFLNTVINAFDSKDSDLIKNALGSLGYKSELSDEYKQFTKYDVYSQLEAEASSFFSKKEKKKTVQLYSRTPTNELPKNTNKSQSILDSTSTADLNPLGKNIINFYRRQKAAEAFGISKSLEEEFKVIKREAIETKNKIIGFANVVALNEDERKAAFDQLYSEIKSKRDIAYAMSSLDEKTGDSLSNKHNEYSQKIPTEADKYIYHAQALNYDAMLAEVLLIGHQANLRPLTEQNVQNLERKREKLGQVEFLLNSNQDVDGASTFIGLGKKSSSLAESALFTNKAISPDGGMVGQHMKAINSLSSEMRGLGMSKEAIQIKNQYAVQQIEATIKMYEKRMEEMQAFSAERSVHSSKRNEKGDLIIEEAVQRKIDSASSDYTNNIQKVIDYLKDKKSNFMSGVKVTDQDIRNTFEDIDVKIAEVDTANISLAEVFRSPTPGGTDPRLHTYRVMQGVAALNQVSNMLSDTRQVGSENKMLYSTERGQTATMMASLGVITYGGGDFDGDPYTVIFHQAADMQKLIQQKQSIVDQRKLSLDNVVKAADDLRSQINKIVASDGEHLKQREKLEEALQKREEQIDRIKNNLYIASNELNEAKNNFERQITDGHKGLQARARKQVANYMGLDERLFVSNKEIMFDTNGKVILDEDGQAQRGLNNEKTYDADAMFVFMEQGYKLMEGVESKNASVLRMMDTVDLLTGYKTSPDVFQDGNFLKELTSRENLVRSPNGKISDESPAIGMLKNRVAQLQNSVQQLTPEQKQFVNNLKDSSNEQYIAYLEQFNSMQKEMEGAMSLHNLENQQKAADKQQEFSKRAFMNQWIGGNIYSGVMSNDTLNKFMVQGGGMTLTEGSFDMTLKTLGKAGGEVLGKTYNTIIGTTFQDAPVISYGRQMLDESSELHSATRTEFQNQAEGNTERRQIAEQNALAKGLEKGTKKFENSVKTELRSIGYSEFDEYIKVTQKAVLKSEGTQGFMKNIHQLLRDSIKLKDGDGELLGRLQEASEEYDRLSQQITANDEKGGDPTARKDLLAQRDSIIGKMASNLGPGPGLKSLIDLDYLTNESSKTGLSINEFESRFLTKGGIDSNRQMLNHYAASMDNLTEEERSHLLDPSTITEESGALLKVARNMTANNIANMVSSFRMSATAVEGRGEIVKSFAQSHKAKLATQLGHHTAVRPQGVGQDGIVEGEDQTGKYIKEKYGVIEAENNGARFDVNRMHKNALGAHLGLEEAHLYNEDGTMSVAYRDKLEKASKKLNISTEEYVLMFDIHNETSREQIKGVFGEDGKEMEQFTVMNMMRKDIARSMLDGRVPGANASKIINESMGSEVLTTMAQLASTNKLDSKGMEIFSSMYKGAIGYMLEATDGVVDVTRKSDGEIIQMKFSEMNAQQKQAYMTKLLHQQMLGTEASQESGFTRSTSEASREFKNINARVIANSNLVIDDMDGTLNGKLGNDFIDALDKAGANTLTGQQQEMYDAMSQEFVRSALDNDEEFDSLMRLSLPTKGDNVAGRKSDSEYRAQMKKKVRAQMKIRQEQDSKKYATSRSRHSQGRSVMNRSSFMNNINTSALDQLSTTASSNALDLFVPLALTAVGGAIQEGSVDGEQLMQLGGAAFTAFQYARTGTIENTTLSPDEYKKRLRSASAVGGIFKFKNALMREGDENVGAAIASLAVQEVTAAAFNTIATPWLSKNIAEHGLGVKHGPAMSALDMKKYQAGQQLAGNLGASLISAVSSTLVSGLLMRGVESMSQNVGEAIQSFLPAAQAVSSVNEAIAKRRQQEAAYEDFEAETDGSEGEVRDYMVMTEATYDPNDYNSMADLQEAQEVEPSNDGSLSIGLLG